MANCEFSEFSYGYALTHSILKLPWVKLGGAPVFPSLIQEGSAGGGFDLKLPVSPFPIFFQFKIPLVLTKVSSLYPSGYPIPYYRLPLRTKAPNQHQLLLELQNSEPLVFYVAPMFHKLAVLDSTFTSAVVYRQSTFISPVAMGLLDSSTHHLSYAPGEMIYWLRSEPKPIEGPFGFDAFFAQVEARRRAVRKERNLVERRISDDEARVSRMHTFFELGKTLETLDSKGFPGERSEIYGLSDLDPREMAIRLSYIAQVRFGLTLALGDAAGPI